MNVLIGARVICIAQMRSFFPINSGKMMWECMEKSLLYMQCNKFYFTRFIRTKTSLQCNFYSPFLRNWRCYKLFARFKSKTLPDIAMFIATFKRINCISAKETIYFYLIFAWYLWSIFILFKCIKKTPWNRKLKSLDVSCPEINICTSFVIYASSPTIYSL